MNQNPKPNAGSESRSSAGIDKSRLRSDLEKALKTRKYILLAMPIVAVSTILQYAGVFAAGNLPNWFGILIVALCAIQLPFLARKISRLETKIAGT